MSDEPSNSEKSGDMDALIVRAIEDGSYFEQAYDWYCSSCLRGVVDLHYVIVLFALCFALLTCSYLNIRSLFPLHHSMPFVKYVDDSLDEIHLIKDIGRSGYVLPDLEVSEYLVSQYVIAREGYAYKNLEQQELYIKNNSAYKVYSEFMDQTSVSNTDSPVVKYRYNGVRDVSILSVDISNSVGISRSKMAMVRYHVVDFDGELTNTYVEQVRLAFNLSDVYMSKSGLIPIEFTVSMYEH